jgi:hypothetical protein
MSATIIGQSIEERSLLNPSFCALLIWSAADGFEKQAGVAMPLEVAFLVLPMILHRATREALPKTTATSLAVWVETTPLARVWVAERAPRLVSFTKQALLFGGRREVFAISKGRVAAGPSWAPKVRGGMNSSSAEVKECLKRAEFLGKWLAKSGSASAIMAFLGVRP